MLCRDSEEPVCRGGMLPDASTGHGSVSLAANLSTVTKLMVGIGAVSRSKLSRNQKFIKMLDFYCGQIRMSGCNGHNKSVLGARAKAKSVTNNFPLLSVLGAAVFVKSSMGQSQLEVANLFHFFMNLSALFLVGVLLLLIKSLTKSNTSLLLLICLKNLSNEEIVCPITIFKHSAV
jgi:hypothetical protein